MRKVTVISLALFLFLTKVAVAQDAEDKARYAAEQWIVLVDDGQYEQSWKESAKSFQVWITSEEWQKRAAEDRGRLGRKTFRKLKEIKSSTSAKGQPAGQILVKYQSSFEKKKNIVEMVTTVLEDDGVWRVSSYVFE